MNDTTPSSTQVYFEITFKNKGVADSQFATIDELRAAMIEDFAEIYGEGNFEITELRLATPEEVEAIKAQAQALEDALFGDEDSFDEFETFPTQKLN